MEKHDEKVTRLKLRMLDAAYKNQVGFLPSSFSILDILVCLYDNVMNLEYDGFVLSKGHAAFGLYAVLEDKSVIPYGELYTFGKYGSRLSLMADGGRAPGVLFSTGSLGLGLANAAGMAHAKKIKGDKGRVFALIGDGELNEGSVWEAFWSVLTLRLNNLVCIIDANKSSYIWQSEGMNIEKMLPSAFEIMEIDGHNEKEIKESLQKEYNRPAVVIAHTVKGKGCKAMEANPNLWHGMAPDAEHYEIFRKELSL